MKNLTTVLLFLIIFIDAYSQSEENPLKFSLGEYNFESFYDTSEFNSKLTVVKKGNTIYRNTFDGRIISINADAFGNNSAMNVLIGVYSGGAHCCYSVFAGHTEENGFMITDTLELGNSDYEIKDLDDDNRREIFAYDDRFAYAFTNYAETRFSPIVYTLTDYKFVNITPNFPATINANIEDLKSQMDKYILEGYKCTAKGEDTFNTDAGSVKAILAPLVLDYYNLGEAGKGYDYVNNVYKCWDKSNFIDTLQNVYKLK